MILIRKSSISNSQIKIKEQKGVRPYLEFKNTGFSYEQLAKI